MAGVRPAIVRGVARKSIIPGVSLVILGGALLILFPGATSCGSHHRARTAAHQTPTSHPTWVPTISRTSAWVCEGKAPGLSVWITFG